MAMQIHGNYGYPKIQWTEEAKEKQAAAAAEKEREKKDADRLSDPQDEYIPSEKQEKRNAGLYRVGQDENGSRKIFYDAPPKKDADSEDGGKAPKAEGNDSKKPEICAGNTNGVDREIRKLKEKKQELERQIQSVSVDEKKVRELEKKLAQVEQELNQKDNDAYRRQHTVFSRVK